MKPEITKEFRERYFAAHLGQEAIFVKGNYTNPSGSTRQVDGSFLKYFAGDWGKIKTALLLRPISAITDAEAIEVAKMAGELVFMSPHKMYWKVERSERMITIREKYHTSYILIDVEDAQILIYEENSEISAQTNTLWPIDYLRRIGIAVGFDGLEVDDLISAGVLKLREGGGEA